MVVTIGKGVAKFKVALKCDSCDVFYDLLEDMKVHLKTQSVLLALKLILHPTSKK